MGNEVFKFCLIFKNAAVVCVFFSTLLCRTYEISRNWDTDHLISLKFIEGHSTSRIKHAFRPQLYTRIFNCFVFIFQRATVCFSKGKEAS